MAKFFLLAVIANKTGKYKNLYFLGQAVHLEIKNRFDLERLPEIRVHGRQGTIESQQPNHDHFGVPVGGGSGLSPCGVSLAKKCGLVFHPEFAVFNYSLHKLPQNSSIGQDIAIRILLNITAGSVSCLTEPALIKGGTGYVTAPTIGFFLMMLKQDCDNWVSVSTH